ncbi:hypothetical protein [Ramlibacter sp.]|uniref:hypothetical protein n=1 Tax=Ramlibacter sp. TaxID=1917967 RepID=UPI0026027AD8|nr:hypothetical protein [Ramlibacter sp.]
MEEFAKNLSSLSWWLGVVAVGIVLNVGSTYLKRPLDGVLSTFSNRWNSRSRRLREAREARIEQVRQSDRELQLLIADELRDRIRAVHTTLLAVFLILFYVFVRVRVPSAQALNSDMVLVVALKVLYWGSLLMLFVSMRSFMRAMSTTSVLRDAASQ